MNSELMRAAHDVARQAGSRLHIHIPSILAEGETFTARVSVTGPDALPPDGFGHTLHFEGSHGIEGLPETFRFDAGRTTGEIPDLTAVGPATALIRARVDDDTLYQRQAFVTSNPAWVSASPPWRVFWGDLHVHTRHSNCHAWRCLPPEWCYRYARDISLLDFVAPADHLRGIVSEDGRWRDLQQLARRYDDPGRFVTFLAFESSHAQGFGGDNNVYFLDDDAAHFWLERDDMHGAGPKVHLKALWEQLDANGKPYFSAPHHTGRSGKYRMWEEDYHDPRHEPLFEIYSSWGSSEKRWSRFPISGGNNDAPAYFVDALKAGARFGLIASSDDHATLPGGVNHFRVEPYRIPSMNGHAQKGLAAVRAPALTREALFEAMRRRDTYATTHVRSLVDFTLAGASMGQEIPADAQLGTQREIRVLLTLDGVGSARVVLMRNGEPIETQRVGGPEATVAVNELVFRDAEPLEKVALRDARYHPDPFAVYYVRIEDADHGCQWTSPIWVDLA